MWQFIVGGLITICFMAILAGTKYSDDEIIQWFTDNMREASPEERKAVHDYIKSISEPTGFRIFGEEKENVVIDGTDQCEDQQHDA